jgi:Carbohydrate-binding family 9
MAVAYDAAMRVPRAPFSLDDPWAVAADAELVELVRVTDGSAPRLPTSVAAMWDDEALAVVFSGRDDLVRATLYGHDEPLWQEDVVELFLAPERLTEYFELEVNPLGTTFDARIESPDGVRTTMRTDLAWTCEGLIAAIRRTPEEFATLVRVPFASLGRKTPRDGETWRANFYRVDRHPDGDEYTAWCPTRKTPPDFHVPAAFGTLVFSLQK